jgi:hypothetical protein
MQQLDDPRALRGFAAVQDALGRLAALPARQDLLRCAAVELARGLGLDRVGVSRVRGGVWVARDLFVAGSPRASGSLQSFWATAAIPLASDLVET